MLFLSLLACGFPVEQRPSCAQYVTCLSARDARDGTDTDTVRFRPEGDCWGNGTGADLCDRACTQGLAYLADREPDLGAACAP